MIAGRSGSQGSAAGGLPCRDVGKDVAGKIAVADAGPGGVTVVGDRYPGYPGLTGAGIGKHKAGGANGNDRLGVRAAAPGGIEL